MRNPCITFPFYFLCLSIKKAINYLHYNAFYIIIHDKKQQIFITSSFTSLAARKKIFKHSFQLQIQLILQPFFTAHKKQLIRHSIHFLLIFMPTSLISFKPLGKFRTLFPSSLKIIIITNPT